MKLKMVMCVGILSLGLIFFTACIDVIANFVNSEPKETSKMIDIIAKDMKKVRNRDCHEKERPSYFYAHSLAWPRFSKGAFKNYVDNQGGRGISEMSTLLNKSY